MTASFDKTLALWTTDGELISSFAAHSGEIAKAEFSKDGQYILTASEDATVKIWKSNGTLIKTIGEIGKVVYKAATFSQDGNSVLTSSNNNTIKIIRFRH
ncbi:MAG: hypothetical protein HND50_16485 [Calditrichaeota bacterium]|nr:hypothetical protein [Calditrichota bacterium]